jgi:hypothetical protein
MKDVIFGAVPAEFRVRTVEPCVIRLPDGNVRMHGDSARFPDRCPRCGSSPASTGVKLRLTRSRLFKADSASAPAQTDANLRAIRARLIKSNRSIKIPFCRRCGWTLKITQFLPGFLGCAVIGFVDPRIQNFRPGQLPWFSAGTACLAGMLTAGVITAVFDYMPKLLIDPGVKVVAVTKDSAELAFDDPMYAEQFVLLNR